MEPLEEVIEQQLPRVLEALRKNWPRHFIPYQTFTILNEFKKANCEFKHTIYLCGQVETGVYLLKLSLPNNTHCIYLYALSNDLSAVEKVLKNSKQIPWHSEPFLLELIPSTFRLLVEEAFATRHIKCSTRPNLVFIFPPKIQLVLQGIPNDTYIDFLKEEHCKKVDQNWPHRYPGSELLHKECVMKNFGLGLFRKSDGKMLSSGISDYHGGIFVLFSDLEFRGKGYATIVVQHMVAEIRKRNREPFCTIHPENTPSLKVFGKVGFQYFDTVDFFRIIQ